ncbi:MAG TPA: hypothetical protein VMQ10_04425, partial [Spirochaetia bacterium]|nr:hypothetical protein [Spirochaetia bacterium]
MSTSNLPGDGGISLLGDHPFARNPDGKLKTRIATAFPARQTVVTVPGIHVTQRQAFVDHLDELRRHRGEPPLTEEEREHEWLQAVDLIVVEGAIQIRPDPRSMPLAFQADDLLQRMLAKHRIRFLGVLDDRVRDAVKRRGELWRITPLPKTPDEMQAMIERSRIGIGGREIYYYSEVLGTRYLTVQELEGLGSLDDEVLRAHLVEIARHLGRRNAAGNPEVAFFGTGTGLSRSDFTSLDFTGMS